MVAHSHNRHLKSASGESRQRFLKHNNLQFEMENESKNLGEWFYHWLYLEYAGLL